jgi:hypothetical protein
MFRRSRTVTALESSVELTFSNADVKGIIDSFLPVVDVIRLSKVSSAMAIHDNYWGGLLLRNLTSATEAANMTLKLVRSSSVISKPDCYRTLWRLHYNHYNKSCLPKKPDAILSEQVVEALRCSSQDREEEGPNNVLTDSNCQLMEEHIPGYPFLGIHSNTNPNSADFPLNPYARAQFMCGCFTNPCYWCSAGSKQNPCAEFIDFCPVHTPDTVEYVTLHAFSIRAYQSFGQPGFPIFAPMSATIELWLQFEVNIPHSIVHDMCYFKESFDVKQNTQVQRFELKHPVTLFRDTTALLTTNNTPSEQKQQHSFRTMIRVVLNNAYQRQVVTQDFYDTDNDPVPDDDFYMCLSRIAFYTERTSLMDISLQSDKLILLPVIPCQMNMDTGVVSKESLKSNELEMRIMHLP